MSELDEFVRWVATRRDRLYIDGLGYGALTAGVDIFRAERLTGRVYLRWVDADQALHPAAERKNAYARQEPTDE